jgi:hypothetical protein
MLTEKLEKVIHDLEQLSPEEQQMIADEIQELLDDAEDIALAKEVLNDPNESWTPWEEVKERLKLDGLL